MGSDLLQHGSVFADDNTLVAGLLAVDGHVQVNNPGIPLGELGHLDGRPVWDLLVQIPQQLLPDDLRHHLFLRLVGRHAVGEQLGPLHGVFLQLLHQLLQPVLLLGRDGDDGVKFVSPAVGRHDLQKLGLLDGVDLVDDQHGGQLFLPDPVDQRLFRRAHLGDRLHHKADRLHVRHGVLDHLHHVVPQPGPGPVEAGGVQKHKLGLAPVHHAADAISGGLGLGGDDGDLFAHQGVGQGRFAHVGPSGDGNHRGFLDLVHSGDPQLSNIFRH